MSSAWRDRDPLVGATIRDKWHVDALLGAGGISRVYAVTHRFGYRAALKMLSPLLANDAEIRARFLREGYISNAVGHPATVRVLDDHADDEMVFLVMELLEGETLGARRRRMGGRLPLAEVLEASGTLLDVLAQAHARGIVHRDVKPDNLFRTTSGETRILDFGIAQAKHLGAPTSAGMVLGTLEYMSPEQAAGLTDVDARTDVWGAGATIYTLLSGAHLYPCTSPRERIFSATSRPPRPLREVAPFVPRGIASVVDCALAVNAGDRWPSAHVMRIALRLAEGRLAAETGRERADAFGANEDRTLALVAPAKPVASPPPSDRTLALSPAMARPLESSPGGPAPSTPQPEPRGHSHMPVEIAQYAAEPVELPMVSLRQPLAVVAGAIALAAFVVVVGALGVTGALGEPGGARASAAAPPGAMPGPPPAETALAIPEPAPLGRAMDAGAD